MLDGSKSSIEISIHALLAESDLAEQKLVETNTGISIHALLAESDACLPACVVGAPISIHALLAESDYGRPVDVQLVKYFYPRSPCGERHNANCNYRSGRPISIHALLAESDTTVLTLIWEVIAISIHALLAESDSIIDIINNVIDNFYPRSPCGERRKIRFVAPDVSSFLSTLSLRRATRKGQSSGAGIGISIHALLAESDHEQAPYRVVETQISIHALLAESDHNIS